MDLDQFCALMDEIKQSRDEVKELKREVNAVHERMTKELTQKKSSYQFKKKAHEIQFNLNSEIEESIDAAKKELSKLTTNDEQDKGVIKKAKTFLDEGLKTLEKQQKYIKVADCSEFGRATVEHYESHPLAADSDNEKHLERAEKEAERAVTKHRRGRGTARIKKKNLSGGAGPSAAAKGSASCCPAFSTTPGTNKATMSSSIGAMFFL